MAGQVLHALLTDNGYLPTGPAPTLMAAKEAIAEHRLSAAPSTFASGEMTGPSRSRKSYPPFASRSRSCRPIPQFLFLRSIALFLYCLNS